MAEGRTGARTASGSSFNPKILFITLLALLVGLVVGAFVVRQRYKARDVVVAVNGAAIDKNDFFRRLENEAGEKIIRTMVGEELYLQFARKLGKAPTDAAVEARLQDMMKQDGFEQKLEASHLSVADLKRELSTQMARQAVLTRDVAVTEAEARRFYDQNVDSNNPKALFYTPDVSRIAVILTPTREQGERAVRAIRSGVPFENAAAIYSSDPSRISNGELPPIVRGRTTSKKFPQLEQAIFRLKIGEQVGPIQVANFWWLIRCLDRQPASRQAYAQVKEQCMLGAALSKLSAADAATIERTFVDFQKQATIQAFWTRYTKAVEFK